MRYETLFPSRFIRSADFQGKDVTLTILKVFTEEIEDKTKAIMSFDGTKKQLVLCRTNAESCKLMWGAECDAWIGKRLTLYAATIKDPFGDGEITATRVRGSPDITEAKSATVQRGRKTIKVSVKPTAKPVPTAKANGKAASPSPPAEPADPTVASTETVPEPPAEEFD